MAIASAEVSDNSYAPPSAEKAAKSQNSVIEGDVERMEGKCRDLRRKLRATRQRRVEVNRKLELVAVDEYPKWLEKRNEAERRRSEALGKFCLTLSRCDLESSKLDVARKWNVTNDCFYVWRSGPFGTINGLRLGSEVPPLPYNGNTTNDGTIFRTMDTNATNPASNGGDVDPEKVERDADMEEETGYKVPWMEINSALGLVALLLSTLEQKPHSWIRFTNEIVPMGSCSKIGWRRGESVTMYNLYSDDSFQLFGKRNFNIALNCLLACVSEAAAEVLKRNRTIALPHSIEMVSGEYAIGGLSVSYGVDGERWTRAMKFLLTDLKWLVAFTAKHVDR